MLPFGNGCMTEAVNFIQPEGLCCYRWLGLTPVFSCHNGAIGLSGLLLAAARSPHPLCVKSALVWNLITTALGPHRTIQFTRIPGSLPPFAALQHTFCAAHVGLSCHGLSLVSPIHCYDSSLVIAWQRTKTQESPTLSISTPEQEWGRDAVQR